MELPFSLFLGLRYLRPKRTFLSIISIISVLGVVIGIAVLIIVIAVMRGFDTELKRKIVGFEPHLTIGSSDLIDNWREISEKVKAIPEVVGVSPQMGGPVIAEYANYRLAPKIRGIDPALDEPITHLSQHIKDGNASLEGNSAIVGEELARVMGVWVGDTITIYSPKNMEEFFRRRKEAKEQGKPLDDAELEEFVMGQDVLVTGIFNSGRYPIDSEFILVPLYLGQELYNLEDSVQGIGIAIKDPYRVEEVKEKVNKILEAYDAPLFVRSWIDVNQYFFDAVRMERNMMFFLLSFVILVAAFCIMNTLITVTVLKTREIGIMKAVGANVMQIVWVFLAQGVVIGFFGNLIGLGSGLLVVHYRNQLKDWLASTLNLEIFPAKVYQFSQLPADINPQDLFLICLIAFVICSLAALIPAYFAARLDPVKALRYE